VLFNAPDGRLDELSLVADDAQLVAGRKRAAQDRQTTTAR